MDHFHGVFTLPEDLRSLARRISREIYGAMVRCVAAALLEMAESRLGVRLGLTLVLHTWTRDLRFHPHIHVLITAGGLTLDGKAIKRIRKKVLLHVKPLAKLFKGKLMDALRQMKQDGIIPMTDGAFGTLMASLQAQDWVVYLKRTFHGPQGTLQYLGRYTHRVGIANSRLLDVTESKVTFRTKDGRSVSLTPVIFLQRFVQHVLPVRFKKIRHAGLYASSKNLAKAKVLLAATIPAGGGKGTSISPSTERPLQEPTWEENLLELTGRDVAHCSACGAQVYRRLIPSELSGTQRVARQRASDRIPRSPP
jgi:hypothetical protein